MEVEATAALVVTEAVAEALTQQSQYIAHAGVAVDSAPRLRPTRPHLPSLVTARKADDAPLLSAPTRSSTVACHARGLDAAHARLLAERSAVDIELDVWRYSSLGPDLG